MSVLKCAFNLFFLARSGSKVRKFQQLVLLLDPMLEAGLSCLASCICIFQHKFAPAPYPYSLQADVDAVNARVAERLKKRGRKDREGWTIVGGHWSSFLKEKLLATSFVDINSIVNWFSFR